MGKSSAPAPDPRIAEQSGRQIDLAEQQYADQKALLDQYSPMFEQQMQLSLNQQTQDQAHAATMWDSYEKNTLPMLQEFQQTARDYNTEGRRTQAAQEAEGQVATQYDTARQQESEQLNMAGVMPGSGKALAMQQALNMSEARAKAGASNQARRQTEATGLALEGQAINVGQGMPAMQLQQQAAGQQAGGQAQGAVAGLSALTAAPITSSFPGMTAGINGLIGNQNLLQERFNNQSSFLKDAMQAGAMAYGAYRSSKKAKHRKGRVDGKKAVAGLTAGAAAPPRRVQASGLVDPDHDAARDARGPDGDSDDAQALAAITAKKADGSPKMPVDRWKYKPGEGDGGEHIGPYAEDVHAAFGDEVAPKGEGLVMPAMDAKVDGAVRALTARVLALRAEAKQLGV